MKYLAKVNVMPLDALLDPQGKAVQTGLHNLGMDQFDSVRIGKHIELHIEASNREEARAFAERACSKLLANPVIEKFEFEISELAEA